MKNLTEEPLVRHTFILLRIHLSYAIVILSIFIHDIATKNRFDHRR